MTLREESGNGPPAGPETGDQPQELLAQQQEPPGQPQEPAAGEAPSRLEVPAPREAPPPLAAAAPPQEPAAPPPEPASPLQESAAPLQESPAMPGTPGGLIARAEPDTGTGPASPGSSPPRRRRSLAAILIVGFAVICLIGLGAFATVLLLHGRTH